jgi:hypothetical protein
MPLGHLTRPYIYRRESTRRLRRHNPGQHAVRRGQIWTDDLDVKTDRVASLIPNKTR